MQNTQPIKTFPEIATHLDRIITAIEAIDDLKTSCQNIVLDNVNDEEEYETSNTYQNICPDYEERMQRLMQEASSEANESEMLTTPPKPKLVRQTTYTLVDNKEIYNGSPTGKRLLDADSTFDEDLQMWIPILD